MIPLYQFVAKAVFLRVTFASLTPCFKSTHPHQTVWTETVSNPISIRPNVPWDSPPPFLAVRFAVSWGAQEEQGIWNTWAGFRNTQGFSYKTCHVADREGFATWENQGWVTWVSSVCPVVLSVSRQIISKLYSRLTSGNISTSYYSFLAHYLKSQVQLF